MRRGSGGREDKQEIERAERAESDRTREKHEQASATLLCEWPLGDVDPPPVVVVVVAAAVAAPAPAEPPPSARSFLGLITGLERGD